MHLGYPASATRSLFAADTLAVALARRFAMHPYRCQSRHDRRTRRRLARRCPRAAAKPRTLRWMHRKPPLMHRRPPIPHRRSPALHGKPPPLHPKPTSTALRLAGEFWLLAFPSRKRRTASRERHMASTGLGTVTRWGKVPAWWLLHDNMDADRFCVMAAMATYADEAGLCDPSQATLARHLRRSRPWVNRIVAQLAELGFLDKTVRARRNGGTTSCLYRLRLDPLPTPVTPETAGVADRDSPCHPDDTSHQLPEQIHTRPTRARPNEAHHQPAGEAIIEVPENWRPGEAELQEAARLCPDVDLEVHTSRFLARCRARGYRYRPSGIGGAWLAWLLEDHCTGPSRKPRHGRTTGPADARRRAPPSPGGIDQRYAAWATAACAPPAAWS